MSQKQRPIKRMQTRRRKKRNNRQIDLQKVDPSSLLQQTIPSASKNELAAQNATSDDMDKSDKNYTCSVKFDAVRKSSRGGGASLRPPPPRGRCSPRRSSTPPRSRPAARASRRRLASSSRSTTPPRPRVPAQLTPSPAGPAPSDALRAQRAGPLIFPPGQGLYVVALVPTCKTPRRERGRARAQVGRGGASAQSPWTRAAWLLHGFT